MFNKLLAVIFISSFTISAIAAIEVPKDGGHPTYDYIKYASCDYSYYQNGYDNSGKVYGEHYEYIANKSFIYALMASNAYHDISEFKIPGWQRMDILYFKTGKGLSVDVYRSRNTKDIVLSFRGTDGLNDWVHANLRFMGARQYDQAIYYTELISKTYPDYKITVTGHSLGGGLALHTSLNLINIDAYAFNTSPRVYKLEESEIDSSYRLILSEKGELLEYFRNMFIGLGTIHFDGPYDEFNFLDDTPYLQHGIYYIARGLTLLAASTGNSLAKKIMRENMGCP